MTTNISWGTVENAGIRSKLKTARWEPWTRDWSRVQGGVQLLVLGAAVVVPNRKWWCIPPSGTVSSLVLVFSLLLYI